MKDITKINCGNLKEKRFHNDRSEIIGERYNYWENGNLMLHCEEVDSKYPLFKEAFSEDGKHILIDGNGHYESMHGNFYSIHEVKDYKWHGTTKSFKNGKLLMSQELKNGLENGYLLKYDDSGNIKSKILYREGKQVK